MDLRATRSQRQRAYELLRIAGDVWAALIEMNTQRFRRGGQPIMGFAELCRELTGTDLGPLPRICAEQVAHNYSDSCLTTAKRKRAGQIARYPRRKRHFYPVRFRYGAFALEAQRVCLRTARGHRRLVLRLSRPVPYPSCQIRSVTLCADAGRLYLEVTREVPVDSHDLDRARRAGVDVGIIHPFAVAADEEGLLVSGRALRAEERLHLSATKARQRKMSPKQPSRGQRGSRRWRKLRVAQRRAESRHRAMIRQAHHEAAKDVVAWAVSRRVGTLVVGDLTGIENKRFGRHHNRRTTRWRRAHLFRTLAEKAEVAGMVVVKISERGTSSTCPCCGARSVAKGRVFACSSCSYRGHRDLVGARNIAARGGGTPTDPSVVTHRRVGAVAARRDRRRQLMDDRRRSCPTPGRLRRKAEELPSTGLPSDLNGVSSPVVEAGDRTKRVA